MERVPIIETAAKAVVKSSSSKMSDTALHSSIDSDQSYLREAFNAPENTRRHTGKQRLARGRGYE